MRIIEKIRRGLRYGDTNRIAYDGWVSMDASYTLKGMDANYKLTETMEMKHTDKYLQKLTLVFSADVLTDSYKDAQSLKLARESIANQIEHMLYGEIRHKISILKTAINYGDREMAENIVDELLKDLGRK